MQAAFARYRLLFKETAITSRSSMNWRDTWFVKLVDSATGKTGIGECAMFQGLSCDDRPDYETRLAQVCSAISAGDPLPDVTDFPSIKIGLEMAQAMLDNEHGLYFQSPFTSGRGSLTINGLVWMGSREKMLERINDKIEAGFHTIKLKIGGIDFESEFELLRYIRGYFDDDRLTIRLDANGSFASPGVALKALDRLAPLDIHSIEQPVRAGNYEAMHTVCQYSPIPIALDEELIGLNTHGSRLKMLEAVGPHYIILKPTLHGGFSGAADWIELAEEMNIGWWITSALESNIGLNAIAQWTASLGVSMPQGLGTGALYTNNFDSPLRLEGERLTYNSDADFKLNRPLQWIVP